MMKTKRSRFTAGWSSLAGLVALLCLAAMPALAQTSGGIKGTVLGMDGKPLANAPITFTRTDIAGSFTMKTDKKGKFAYYTLPVGTYDISVKTPDGKEITVEKGTQTKMGAPVEGTINLQAAAAQEAGMAPPPPGMTKEQAEAYEKKVKEQQASNQKLGQLNALLKQNKTYLDAKQYDQAIAVMEQAVQLDQTHDILYANLAEDYADAKQYDKAADAYQKALTLKPTNAGYEINLGTVLSKAGKVDEANAAFGKAATMDPTQAKMAIYNEGVVLLNKGDMKNAATAFDKLIAMDPTNADAWYEKGICLLGQAGTDPKTNKLVPLPGTAEALEKSIQLAPNGPNAAGAKAALQAVKGGGI